MQHRLLAVMLSLSLLLTGCTAPAENTVPEVSPETEVQTEVPVEISLPEKQPTEFDTYVSNTAIATGANYSTKAAQPTTYRTYLPVEESGELEYCFYCSDVVDSTWERGRASYAGMEGSDYQILAARVTAAPSPESELTDWTEVTFDGNAEKSVTSGEAFWSDPVTLDIPEGNYLVWEWTVQGEQIPCIKMSELAYSYTVKDDGETVYNMDIPLPKLFGARRAVQRHLTCFGDSITQGAQTTPYAANFWVSELSESLGSSVSVWNVGLGYARASDAALCGNWLERAKSGDVVTLAFGTNDIAAGKYNGGKPSDSSTPEEITEWLRTLITELQGAGCQVILFNAPPFDYDAAHEAIRAELNAQLPALAEELHVPLFDLASLLSDPQDPAKSLYGGHPDDTGCRIVADAFLEQFGELLQ